MKKKKEKKKKKIHAAEAYRNGARFYYIHSPKLLSKMFN